MDSKIQNKLARFGVAVTGLAAAAGAIAQTSPAVTAVNTAKTDGLEVAGALVAMGVAIWGALYLYRKFFK